MTDCAQLQDDFERSTIRGGSSRRLFVEAGAGTGKTTELVARIVELIARGEATLDQIAAITFTDAAAGELRQRLRVALAIERSSCDDDQSSRARACAVAMRSMDEAAISTIHGFAHRLLQAYPLEAGLPPVFSVVDSMEAQRTFQDRLARFLNQQLLLSDAGGVAGSAAGDTENLWRTAMSLGVQVRHVRELACKLHDSWHRLDSMTHLFEPEVPSAGVDRVLLELENVLGYLKQCRNFQDRLALRLQDEVVPWRDALRNALAKQDQAGVLRLLRRPPRATKAGRKSAWPNCHLELCESLVRLKEEASNALFVVQDRVIRAIVALVSGFVLGDVLERRKSGTLEFHDLLVFARDLVRDDPSVRTSVSSRYRHIFIDEFQDTDPLQSELARLLVSSGRDVALFTVGDPKQSIYRFRGADIAQYANMRNDVGEGVVSLVTNFRTLPGVLHWVNQVFERVLSSSLPGDWQGLQPGRSAVAADREVDQRGSVSLLGEEFPKGAMSAAEVRNSEALAIAEAIGRAKREGWPVGEGNRFRGARYRDIAVLMPTRVSMSALEKAFHRHDIPFRVESRSLVWSAPEISELLALLEAIEDPTNQLAVIAALRSSALGCSDVELLRWVNVGGSWDYREETPRRGDVEVVEDAFCFLSSLHARRWQLSVSELLGEVIESRRLFELAFAHARQRESWSRIRFLRDRARWWEEEKGGALRGFLDWSRDQADSGADVLECVIPESDDDAVRVMTIHAAKGLEFPVVFLAGLGSTRASNDSVSVRWGEGSLDLRIAGDVDYTSRGFSRLNGKHEEQEWEEQKRLLYVAATRARDHLVVSVHRTAGRRCLAALLASAAEGVHLPSIAVSAGSSLEPMPVNIPSDYEDDIANRMRALEHGSRPAFLSATEIRRGIPSSSFPARSHVGSTHGAEERASSAESRDAVRGQGTGTALGRAVHRALELVNPHDIASWPAAALWASREEKVLTRSADVLTSLRLALKSETFQEAQAGGRYWREMYLSGSIDDVVIEGVADLVYEGPAGLVIVDYKTEEPFEVTAMLDTYRWQLTAYAWLLSRNLGIPVCRAGLLCLAPSLEEAQAIWLDDVDTSMSSFASGVRGLIAGT